MSLKAAYAFIPWGHISDFFSEPLLPSNLRGACNREPGETLQVCLLHSHVRSIRESNQLSYLNRVMRNRFLWCANNRGVDERAQADFEVRSMASIRAACNKYAYIVARIARL